ncbi:MAG: Gfo/Idh/MocA family protein [Bryobacteraceae bacterium]
MISSRRAFLGASGAALAGARPGPNDTINLGLIGCGARARWAELPSFQKIPGVRWTAVCDVNSNHLADMRKRAGGDRIAAYKDFRGLIEDRNVDVVVVATNQHWHVLPLIAACQAGKDVYVEKPLGNSIGEGRFAIEAARKYNRIVQIGTQQHSQLHFQKAVEVVQSGRLGDISEVKVWDYENQSPGPGSPPDCDPPPELDWDFYVGPAPYRRYNPNIYYKYGYDWFKLSGGGHQVAWGVHHFDIVLWAMGVRWPRAVSAMGGDYAFESNREWPDTISAVLEFGPGPVARRGFLLQYTMRVGGRRDVRSHGQCYIGTQASMLLDRSGYYIVPEPASGKKAPATGMYVNAEESFATAGDDDRAFQVFIENVRQRRQPAADLTAGHHATNVGHLINVAYQAGRTIRWDGENERVAGDAEANRFVRKPYRAPWKLAV